MRATHTPIRNMRIPDSLWYPAQEKARSEGRTISDVLREALLEYLDEHDLESRNLVP